MREKERERERIFTAPLQSIPFNSAHTHTHTHTNILYNSNKFTFLMVTCKQNQLSISVVTQRRKNERRN